MREEHRFAIGQRETHDALRALDIIGVTERNRVRTALRLVCCASPAQTRLFDRAFDDFFEAAESGVAQTAHAPRHTRPGREKPPAAGDTKPKARRTGPVPSQNDESDGSVPPSQRQGMEPSSDPATGWHLLRARYSPATVRGTHLVLDVERANALRKAAGILVRSVQLGRSRRWKACIDGGRFDMRRTIRASLQTGGDPIAPRYLGHPPRNPRFVVLIDGSRSMTGQTAAITAFAAALCTQTDRANIFVFSTALRDVTRELRAAIGTAASLADLGEAWGGGTKIGTSLAAFVDEHGARLLTPDTVTIVFSDGLDAGDIPQLEGALREIDRRSAGLVWLNPHAAQPGFTPTARGMRAALRYTMLLAAADDERDFIDLAARIARTPRIRGRRR